MIRPLAAAFAVASFLATLVPAAAQTPAPDPAALFAQQRAAAGGAAWDSVAEIVERGTFAASGLAGPYVSYIDPRGGKSKMTMTLAGTLQGSGYDGTGAWGLQGTLVQPLDDPAAVATARTAAYVARDGWWHPSTDPAAFTYLGARACGSSTCDVVRVVPQGGDPIDVWIDSSTHLVAKTVSTDGTNVTTTVTFSDYRPVHGVMYPYTSSVSNGDPKNDQVSHVSSVAVLQTLVAADVARPVNKRTSTIAGGAASTTLPLDLDNPADGHIVVIVRVNGSRPLHMIFDTGGSNCVTPEVAREIGLHGSGAIGINGAGENSVSVQLASGATLAIGGATLRDQQFAIVPLPESLLHETARFKVDGLVGYEVLKNFVVSIDYVHRTMTLTDPAKFSYRAGGTAIAFKSATIPVIPVSFGQVTGQFMLDTGNAFFNTISEQFAGANSQSFKPTGVMVVSSGNLGGALHTPLARAMSMQIGPYAIAQSVFAVTASKKGAMAGTAFAGNIGAEVLSRFDLVFDYSRGTIYFKPNANFAKPFDGTRDGMSLYRPTGAALEISYVNPNSPAWKAGLRAGDKIVGVAGVAAAPLGASDIAVYEAAHGAIDVTYVRAGKRGTAHVVLAEMVP